MWTSLQHNIVKTRKPHQCAGCHRMFPAGVEMRVNVGMWEGDPPSRGYYCLVCDDWISTQDMTIDDTYPEDNWALDYDFDHYATYEGKHGEYIRAAGVLTQVQFRAMREMYYQLRMGERWREYDARKAATA